MKSFLKVPPSPLLKKPKKALLEVPLPIPETSELSPNKVKKRIAVIINEDSLIDVNKKIETKKNDEIIEERPRTRSNFKKKKTLNKAQSFAEKDNFYNKIKKFDDLDSEPLQLTKLTLPKIEKKAHRIVGTPDYMAPEVLRGEGLTNPVLDWWSVGFFTLLFSLIKF